MADDQAAAGAQRTLLLAWVGTLALSRLPEVVLREFAGVDAAATAWLWVPAAGLLLAATWAVDAARPLRRYFVVMTVVLVAAFLVLPWLLEVSEGLTADGTLAALLGERALVALTAVVVAGVLLATLLQFPSQFFLVPGDLRAPTTVAGRRVRWNVLAPASAVLLAGGFAFMVWPRPASNAAGLLAALPLVLAAALCNAVGEEVLFRAAPLSQLHRVVGPDQAVLMTAVWFGLGHYYGSIPAGPVGAMGAGALAVLLGKAMVETRGLVWPVVIHLAIDTVIFAALAAGQ